MNKNLVIFFGDGESDNLSDEAVELLKKSLGDEFLVMFEKKLTDKSKAEIKTSPNVCAFVNPYWNTTLPNIDPNSLQNILSGLCEIAQNSPKSNIFIIPYTLVLGDLNSIEYDSFYKYMSESFKNNGSPENLFVAYREDVFYGKLTSQYQWLELGNNIKQLVSQNQGKKDIFSEITESYNNPNEKY